MNPRPDHPLKHEPAEGTFAAYLDAIRAHKMIVFLITLAAVGASVGVLVVRSPQYEATAYLLIEPVPPDDPNFVGLPVIRADGGDPARTIQTAASLVDSRQAADLAAQRLDGSWTGDRVLDATRVEPQGDSDLLLITATAGEPEEAAAVANAFARSTVAVRSENLRRIGQIRIDQLEARLESLPPTDQGARAEFAARLDQIEFALQRGDPTVSMSQGAVAEDSPTGSPAALIVGLALIAGLVLGSGTAVLLELTTRRVRDEEEATRLYPIPVLARVPILSHRSRRGPPGSNWYMPPGIREPFRTLAIQLEQRAGGRRTVMITSPTQGDGKTTSGINLAITLAATGKRVLVLDFDLRNPQVGRALRIDEGPGLSDLVDPKLDIAKLLVHPSELRNFRVLPVAFNPAEGQLSEAAAWRLPELIRQARALADYVIVDTPPLGEVSDALSLVPVVDDILVVIRPGNTRRSHLGLARELLDRIGKSPEGLIVIGAAERAGRGYYGYGAGSPDLVLGAANSGSDRDSERERARGLGEEGPGSAASAPQGDAPG